MNQRIQYLKNLCIQPAPDIDAYRELVQQEYKDYAEQEELLKKAHFLSCFAKDIPIVLDSQELICGSMRFWHSHAPLMNKGHIIVDYRMILSEGICGIRKKLSALNTKEAKAFLLSVDALTTFIRRYAQEANAHYQADGSESMKKVFENCQHLLEKAPQTFHQALQLVWFVHLFLHAEGMCAAFSFGRFDAYMYPFYQKDIEAGFLNREQAKELLMCFWLKTCEGDESQNLTVGGDIENDLTMLCLEVTQELKVPQPSLSVRICEKTSQKLWQKTIQLIKCKIGMPAIFNDTVVIKSLESVGITHEDAKNYGIVGCYEANPDGKAYGVTAAGGVIILHNILLDFLNEEREYQDFSELYKAFLNFFSQRYHTDILDEFRRNLAYIREKDASPFESACMRGCIDSGIAAERGGCTYTMFGINILGIGTLIDSLYTMKKLIFEQKACDYTEFIRQVKNNFPDRELAARCKSLPGKYGTDSTETNELAHDLSVFIANLINSEPVAEGVISYAGLFAFLSDVYSQHYPATPDGRLAGERISYGIAASDYCEDKNITSILNSAAHIANDRFADGNPLMFSISEKEVAGEQGDAILKSLIQAYFKSGGFHLQINVTDADLLKQAQKNPDDYRDLLIRISGYSAYFTGLNVTIQNALIERSEQSGFAATAP